MAFEPYWGQVIKRERVWADTRETHKMGWADPGVRIKVVEKYQKWLRFEEHILGEEIKPFVEGYKEWWILAEVVVKLGSDTPPPPPPPGDTDDAELGAAFRTIATFLAELFG